MPEKNLGYARLQRNQRRLVDISEGEVSSTDQVVQLVSKDSIPGMLRQDISYNLNREFSRSEGSTQPEDRAQIFLNYRLLPGFHGTCGI
jgi:hypothetical protein